MNEAVNDYAIRAMSWGVLGHLALVRQDYHLSLHRLEGGQCFHLAMAENGRVRNVCQTGQRKRGIVAVG